MRKGETLSMGRFRSFLIFFVPFLVFFFYFTNQKGHEHFDAVAGGGGGGSSHMEHGYVDIPFGYEVPTLKIVVTQDPTSSWLLEVQTNHFTFAPKKVGAKDPSYNEGHAHLYINGEKVTRLYGSYYDLGALKPGKNEMKVTLNANNHGVLRNHGKAIESSTVVEVGS